jgi:tetratricopeptide (TPR) repeat protein
MTLNRRLRPAALALCLLTLAGCRHAPESAPPVFGADVAPPTQQSQAHAHYMAGVISDLNEASAEALEQFATAARLDPDNEDLLLEISERLAYNGRGADACEVLEKATSRAGASGDLFARLGLIRAQLGQTNEAIAACRTALRKAPDAVEAYRTLFAIYLRDKQLTQAHEVLDQASQQTDLPPDFVAGLAEMYTTLSRLLPGRREELRADALRALTAAEKLNPSHPDLRLKIADGFNALGQREQAAPIYLDLLNRYPDSPLVRTQVRAKLIDIYLRGQDRTNATTQLEAMARDHPSDAQIHFILGSLASEQKHFARAADCFRKALLFKPDFESAYYDLAMAQIAMNDSTNALATMDQAQTRFGGRFITEYLFGLAYSVQTNYAVAIQHLTSAEVIAQATDRQRLSQYLYFQIGIAYERLGNLEQAVVYLEKSLEVAPKFTEAMNYLGYLWADRGENLPRARQLLEQAVQLEPKNGAYLDSLGWAYFKLGLLDKALPLIQQAITLTPEPDATLFDHLGDIYDALKEPVPAREAWQKALQLDPKNVKLERKLHPEPAATPGDHP